MDSATLQKIQDLLSAHQSIGVAVGQNPSVDEMAAALSVYLYLNSLGKKVSIASPTQPLVEVSTLVGINKVKTALDGDGGDLIVSFPYSENEIQKVSYTIENGFLNIVVKAGENGLTFTENDVKYTRGGGVPTLLFVVGTPRLSDLGQLFDTEALKDTIIINIDNKQDNQGFGDVVLVSSNYSSVSEEVAQLISYLEPAMDGDIAQNLMLGISDATSNFQSPSTSYLAFEMAGFLLRRGAQRAGTGHISRSQWSEEELRPFNPVSAPAQQQRPMQQQRSQNQGQNRGQNQQRRDQRDQRGTARQAQGDQNQQDRNQNQNDQGQQGQRRDQSAAPNQTPEKKQEEEKNPNSDWLLPKVYRGPTA